MTTLSVLVPAYNEQHLIVESLSRLRTELDRSAEIDGAQVIVVDDRSTDATPEVLRAFAMGLGLTWSEAAPQGGSTVLAQGRAGKTEWIFLRHEKNGGKGNAVRTALTRATCDITVIHDADLEYNPRDLERLVRVFREEKADAVFGSRF